MADGNNAIKRLGRAGVAVIIFAVIVGVIGVVWIVKETLEVPISEQSQQKGGWDTVKRIQTMFEADKVLTIKLQPSEYKDINVIAHMNPLHNVTELEQWITWAKGERRNYYIEHIMTHTVVSIQSNSTEPMTIINCDGGTKTYRLRATFSQESLMLFSVVNDGKHPMSLSVRIEAVEAMGYIFIERTEP